MGFQGEAHNATLGRSNHATAVQTCEHLLGSHSTSVPLFFVRLPPSDPPSCLRGLVYKCAETILIVNKSSFGVMARIASLYLVDKHTDASWMVIVDDGRLSTGSGIQSQIDSLSGVG